MRCDERERACSSVSREGRRIGAPAEQPEPGGDRQSDEAERGGEARAFSGKPAQRGNALGENQPQGAVFAFARDAAIRREDDEERAEQL